VVLAATAAHQLEPILSWSPATKPYCDYPGVEVEVVVPPAASAPRIADAEELAPLQLFQQYAQSKGLSTEVRCRSCLGCGF
jgi:hypothetical protein